jgi:hypothetical protein
MNDVIMDGLSFADFTKLRGIGVYVGKGCQFVKLQRKDGTRVIIGINRKRHPHQLYVVTNSSDLTKIWSSK